MLQSIAIPFFTILVAEFLDKSQLSLILLASKTKHHISLLLGAMLAFLLVDGIAIFFGSYLTAVIPKMWINIFAAIMFMLFGIKTLLEKKDGTKQLGKIHGPLVSGFTLVFLSEWGDKTQLASAIFATRYDPVPVLIGVLSALTVLSVVAVFLSHAILKQFDRALITKVAGIIFIILGISFLIFR